MRAFSADLVKYNIRVLQYIGELCRYLCTAPPNAEDDKVRVDFAIGNGMRPDVWDKFQVSTVRSRAKRCVRVYIGEVDVVLARLPDVNLTRDG